MSVENSGGHQSDLSTHPALVRAKAIEGGARYRGRGRPSMAESNEPADTNCRNCGHPVTERFVRVFGNNHNEVFGCLECMTATEVKKGGARAEDVDTSRIDGMETLR